jgi:3-oxoacyl-[acyl-carrier protein] reductase
LGASVARYLAARGFAVAVHANSHPEPAELLAKEIGNGAIAVTADVTDWDAMQAMVDQVRAELGTPQVLVACAGIRKDYLLAGQSVADWKKVIDVNLIGTMHLVRAALPRMLKARKGTIISVVSPAASMGNPGQTAYSASKAGLIGFTRSLAHEIGQRGLTANAISPGFMATEMTSDISPVIIDFIVQRSPMRKLAEPDEVAKAVGFLVDSPQVTGQVIAVDCGLSA